MNKKAALELSINAIVVLILAITILGLGIGFIRNQFGGLTKQFTAVNAEIQDQLINKIKESGDLLVFDRAELQAGVGKKDVFYIGVKNTASNADQTKNSVCYHVGIRCIRALKSDNHCITDTGQDLVPVGGIVEGVAADTNYAWFQMFDQVDIKNNDIGVYPITVQIAKAKPDTYAMEILVEKDDSNADCSTGGGVFKPYQSKQFFVVLS
jgi:hypothetical protein